MTLYHAVNAKFAKVLKNYFSPVAVIPTNHSMSHPVENEKRVEKRYFLELDSCRNLYISLQ